MIIWLCVLGIIACTHNWAAIMQCFAGWWCFQVDGELNRMMLEAVAMGLWLVFVLIGYRSKSNV